ncbi:MAG: TolB family protein, partial [Gemmatimonadales bacterium]
MTWKFVLPALIGLALGSTPVQAQRQPVLQQIKVPHSYYFREMYLPQATSGPSSVAWSPDGKSLIYSMQGSLWRQRVATDEALPPESLGVAVQLTDGPGYDYQPDWSPDGRFVAYASYRNDAIELRLLDLSTLESRALVSNGAVNVEPKWSPDGSRIAFVSTAYEGRWHVYVADVAEEAEEAGESRLVRLTEDHDSG